MFEELGFEHCLGVEGFSSWAFSVVEVSELGRMCLALTEFSTCFIFTVFSIYKVERCLLISKTLTREKGEERFLSIL